MSAIELVIDLPFLAGEINDAHKHVTYHARGMLLEAKRAGDALLAAKGKVRHGEFKAWVASHTRLSDRTAQEYMRVSKMAKSADLRAFEGGVRAFLEAHAKPRPVGPVQFDVEDAERALRINDRVERGVGAERDVAASKLETVASQYGMTAGQLVERSRALCPDRDKAPEEVARNAKMAAAEARISDLEEKLERLLTRRSQLFEEYANQPREAILEALVDALLTIENS